MSAAVKRDGRAFIPGAGASIAVPLADRFWLHVNKNAPGGCWEWTAQRNAWGYGLVSVDRKPRRAHRIVFSVLGLPGPTATQVVCHRCDNPPCVNPAHLFFGTHKDNVRDMYEKGRARSGVRQAAQEECLRGHLFDPANTRIDKRGSRHCRACDRDRMARKRQEAK